MKKFLLLLLLFLRPGAATYYADRAGNDANSCASAQTNVPGNSKLTLAGAFACMAGGDTLILGDGNYPEQIRNTLPPSGSPGAPTIIKSANYRMASLRPLSVAIGGFGAIDIANRAYVTFDGITSDGGACDSSCRNNDAFRINASSHITIQNSEIKNFTLGADLHDCGSSPNGVEVTLGDGAGGHNTAHYFAGNYIHDMGYTCLDDGLGAGYAFYIQESNNILELNLLTHNAAGGAQFRNGSCASGAGSGNTFRKNVSTGNGRTALVITSCTDNTKAYDNVLANATNGEGLGVSFYQNPTNVLLANNTITGNLTGGMYFDNSGGGHADTVDVENNILYSNGGGAIRNVGGTNITCKHNLGVTGGEAGSNSCSNTATASNPLFIDAAGGNYGLLAGSPAIGAGANFSGSFTDDAAGLTRTVPWDMGAFKAVTPPGGKYLGFFAALQGALQRSGSPNIGKGSVVIWLNDLQRVFVIP